MLLQEVSWRHGRATVLGADVGHAPDEDDELALDLVQTQPVTNGHEASIIFNSRRLELVLEWRYSDVIAERSTTVGLIARALGTAAAGAGATDDIERAPLPQWARDGFIATDVLGVLRAVVERCCVAVLRDKKYIVGRLDERYDGTFLAVSLHA